MKLIYKITPKGPLYTEDPFDNSFPSLRSDHLFKAIASTWSLLWGEDDWAKVLQKFVGTDIPFSLTSVFPIIQNVFFLPRCMAYPIENNSLKHISWMSATIYQNWLENKPIGNQGKLLPGGIYCHSKDNIKLSTNNLWKMAERLRNRIKKEPHTVEVFLNHQIYYNKNLELYFIAEVQQKYQHKLEGVVRLLAHEGVGSKRSLGSGLFTYHPGSKLPENLSFLEEPVEHQFIVLSLYQPSIEDVRQGILNKARYNVLERSIGYHSKKYIRVLSEGSYFQDVSSFSPTALVKDGNSYYYIYPFKMAIREALL